jgi:hypothetical protein
VLEDGLQVDDAGAAAALPQRVLRDGGARQEVLGGAGPGDLGLQGLPGVEPGVLCPPNKRL